MNKVFQTILIISIAVFGVGIFAAPPVSAQVDNLVVQFEQTPLFNEANFVPGGSVTRWVKVTNNSGSAQRIATEAINENDPDGLASQLNLTIKEGATVIFNDTLKKFFDQGETYLSSLANGATTQYDFTIAFNSGAGDDYQGKTLGFDIIVGFEGTEGGLPLPQPGSGGGGGLPPGLTISNTSTPITTETSVTIIWDTSYASTSQVIYALEGELHTLNLADNTGTPPKYGYARTTPESDTTPKVTAHSVTITGLSSGTMYYYRAVSHSSLAISQEYTFTTSPTPTSTPAAPTPSPASTSTFTPVPTPLPQQTPGGQAVAGAETTPEASVTPEVSPTPGAEESASPEFPLAAAVGSFFNLGGRGALPGILLIILFAVLAYFALVFSGKLKLPSKKI
jgi:hypothetical protein